MGMKGLKAATHGLKVAAIALVAALALVSVWAAPAGALRDSSLGLEAVHPLPLPATTTTKLAIRPLVGFAREAASTIRQSSVVAADIDPGASPLLDNPAGLAPKRGPGTGLGPGAMWRGEGWVKHFSESPEGIRLFEETRAYRAKFPGSASAKKYRNFVTADVVVDGRSRLVHFKNTPRGLHSEERLITWVERMKARGHAVEVQRLFTERAPCGISSANCLGKLADAFAPTPEVYYNILHGAL